MEDRELKSDGTTEMEDQSHLAAKVMMAGKFMKLKAKTPPKGYYWDRYGRLRPINIKEYKPKGDIADDRKATTKRGDDW